LVADQRGVDEFFQKSIIDHEKAFFIAKLDKFRWISNDRSK